MKTVTVISHKGVPISAITDPVEANLEFEYLSYHGDGYAKHTLELEESCGNYARLAEIQARA